MVVEAYGTCDEYEYDTSNGGLWAGRWELHDTVHKLTMVPLFSLNFLQ